MRSLILLTMTVAAAFGQRFPVPSVPYAQIRAYFELTEAQVLSLTTNNDEYNRFVRDKQLRISQVQREIAELTAASPLDPLGLGLRYAELEGICRQLKDKANEISKKNLALFTDAQKAKVKALEDAVKLVPTYYEAQTAGLAGPYNTGPAGFSISPPGVTFGLSAGFIFDPTSACQSFPTVAFRTGDFTQFP